MILIDKISLIGKFLIAAGSSYLLLQQIVISSHCIHEMLHSLSHSAFSGGFLSGTLHALTGPDHMAILLPLIFNKRWYHSCIYGVVWGCGHGVTSVVIGLVSFAMKSYVVDLSDLFTRYRFVMDGVVGLTLVVIGLMGIAESKNDADGAEDEGKNVKETTDQHDIENINTPQDIAINLSNGSSIATNINSNTRPLFAYLALFVNGAVLGVSWDGLPSLAPSIVLNNTHSLSLFLAAYLLGTVLAMGTASGAVGQATYYISHRMSNNNTASTADSATEASNDTSKSTHISSHLAYMSSLVSCLIGAAWVLLAVLKYVISVTSGDSVIVGSDTVYSNINVNNIIGNDGTGHIHHFEEVQSLQHSRDHVFHRVAHSHDEMSGDRLSSHLDMLFSACSVLLILAVMFVTIGREYHLLGCGNTANSSTGTNSIQTRITSVVRSFGMFVRRVSVNVTQFCSPTGCWRVEKNQAYTV